MRNVNLQKQTQNRFNLTLAMASKIFYLLMSSCNIKWLEFKNLRNINESIDKKLNNIRIIQVLDPNLKFLLQNH